jgi:hypothetical protein
METSSPKAVPGPKAEPILLVKPAVKPEAPVADLDPGPMVPLGKLPASFRKTLLGTPQKEWYRLRAIRVRHEETVELAETIPVVDHVLEVAPPKLIKLLRQGAITPHEIDAGFRRIRDASNALKDACRHVAALAQLEIKAWKEGTSQDEGEAPLLEKAG